MRMPQNRPEHGGMEAHRNQKMCNQYRKKKKTGSNNNCFFCCLMSVSGFSDSWIAPSI